MQSFYIYKNQDFKCNRVYSPNLNWMERLWKLVKKKCLDNIYYETFEEFTSGINDCLSRVETDYQSELNTLM
jgi:hypothetical protein